MLWLYISVCVAAALGYAWVNLRYFFHWWRLPSLRIEENFNPTVEIDIIIIARNESHNIIRLLQSLVSQNYPKALYKINLVDDHSDDGSQQLAQAFLSKQAGINWQILQLADYQDNNPNPLAFKKRGLAYAVKNSSRELIVCTDADCVLGQDWLRYMAAAYQQKQPFFISAPVLMEGENKLIHRFQQLDFLGMMSITAAGYATKHWLANGANMGFSRQIFEQVGGYEQGGFEYASGDDMFLLHKIAKLAPNKVYFIKNPEAVVWTATQSSWAGLYQQRLRWATKSKGYDSLPLLLTLGLVWLSAGLFSLNCCIFWLNKPLFFAFLTQIGIKMAADRLLLQSAARFYRQGDWLWYFIPCFFTHKFYLFWVGLAANVVKSYRWKGRKVS